MNGPLGFGRRLQELRLARGLTPTQLARAIHGYGHYVAPSSIRLWERSENYPGFWHLLFLARFFNVSIDDLLDHHPKENENAHQQLAG